MPGWCLQQTDVALARSIAGQDPLTVALEDCYVGDRGSVAVFKLRACLADGRVFARTGRQLEMLSWRC
jgi:hypothetical protein